MLWALCHAAISATLPSLCSFTIPLSTALALTLCLAPSFLLSYRGNLSFSLPHTTTTPQQQPTHTHTQLATHTPRHTTPPPDNHTHTDTHTHTPTLVCAWRLMRETAAETPRTVKDIPV